MNTSRFDDKHLSLEDTQKGHWGAQASACPIGPLYTLQGIDSKQAGTFPVLRRRFMGSVLGLLEASAFQPGRSRSI